MAELRGVSKLNWSLSSREIKEETEQLIERAGKVFDSIGSLQKEDVSFENTLKLLGEHAAYYNTIRNVLEFPQHVSPDKEIREASTVADKKLSEFEVEMSMREDVFKNLLHFKETKTQPLENSESERYLERLIKLGKRNGLHLSKEIRDKIKEIKKRISDLGIDFSKNLNEENTVLEFADEELAGLPKEFIESLEKGENGKRKVTLKYPHYFPCMRKASNPKTRQALEKAFNSRCLKENTAILEELVELRQKMATILGYPTHSSYVLEMRMAQTPENVSNFLSDLAKKLEPLGKSDLQCMLELKAEECNKLGYENDGMINGWDLRYYMTMIEETKYAVDQNKLKEYFPMSVVTEGLLDIYQELLKLKFEEISDPSVWHEDVRMFSVKDAESGELLGYFYLDLFPREGKFGHAACFPIQPGCQLADGSRQLAVAAMVANFTKPTEERPSLLMHTEVETYFHEFGHVMHGLCTKALYPIFSGTSVERDFVEAPSQMLENWCWEKEPLKRMSSHYKDSTPLPDDMLDTLIKSRNANTGAFNLRQQGQQDTTFIILLGTFDQTIHTRAKREGMNALIIPNRLSKESKTTQEENAQYSSLKLTLNEADTASIMANLSQDILGVPATPGTNMPASFGHLAGGYDAQYYGYMWSEVYSMDMFYSRFKKEGVMNSKVGIDYRRCILEPGGSLDAKDILRNFLGREPNNEAFLKSKGIMTVA